MTDLKQTVLELLRAIKPADEDSRIILEQVYGALAVEGTKITYERSKPTENNVPIEDFELHNID